MVEIAYFFDSINYDEAAQADFNDGMLRPSGIFPESLLGTLTVTAPNGNLSVTVGAGEANVKGFYYRNTANKVLTIAANSSGSTRVDRVVLRLNRAANTLTAIVIQGTPGAGAPAYTQVVGGTWDWPVAQVLVANGASVLTNANITDERVYSMWSASAVRQAPQVNVLAKGTINSDGTFSATTGFGVASSSVSTVTIGSNNYRGYTINLSTPSKNAAAPYSYQVLILHANAPTALTTLFVFKNSRSQFVICDGLTNSQPIDFIVFDTV
jgi:hypothetical protein